MAIFLTLIVAAVIAYFMVFKKDKQKDPQQLLDLDTTTLAERQRAYGRGLRMQQRYDILQRQAELTGDTETLEAIRTNSYDGPLPELEDTTLQYFCIKDKGYHVSVWPKNQGMQNLDYLEFDIAGMTFRGNLDDYIGEHAGTLEAEHDNDYDPNAIKVLAEDGHHVGYVPKDMTADIRKFTTLPCRCYFYIGNNDGTYYSDAYITQQ